MSFLRRQTRQLLLFFDNNINNKGLIGSVTSKRVKSSTGASCSRNRSPFLVGGIRKMAEKGNSSKAAASTSSNPVAHSKNRLQYEKSPYLLQHQTNPVDWYPWGEEAFALAKEKDKPIFLSVGYSTCHWCHVMERESFESPSIAALMNDAFVNIKMDREEHPDIDRIYMTFVQAISGSGGWPMSVWLTPELEPFYGGTYYPPDDRYYGRPGFRSLIQTISEQYTENREKTNQSASKIMEVLKRSTLLAPVAELPSAEDTSTRCLQQLTRSYEPTYGGFSDHPKFPQPVNLLFLLDNAARKNSSAPDRFSTIKMVENTLEGMAKGGIHDHVGQGFARYSVDKKWHVPHFEKMLYDQAQLVCAYTAAFNLTKKPQYAEVVRDILKYVERDLTHPESGGFFSGEDADSLPTFDSKEKKEGAFYVWRSDEVETCLGGKASTKDGVSCADVFKAAYGIEDKGNCDPYSDPHEELKEQNVLFQAKTPEEVAKKFGLSKEEVDGLLDEGRTVLFNYRNINRPRPGLDTKFVTSWNGLMITGYARAGMGLDMPPFIAAAVKAMDFLQKNVLQENGDLLRTCYRDDEDLTRVVNLKTPILGCVDDFANVIAASIELFHATFDPKYLEQAIKLQEKQDELFWDSSNGGFFNSRADLPSVILRMKDDDDGAEPSSNSTSAVNLLRLFSLTNRKEFKDQLDKLLKQFGERLTKVPITLPVMTSLLPSISSPLTVLLTGENIMTSELLRSVRSHLLPTGAAIVGLDTSKSEDEKARLTKILSPSLVENLTKSSGSDVKVIVIKGDNQPETVGSTEELSKILTP